jgi:arylsulfatase A-like enzyme
MVSRRELLRILGVGALSTALPGNVWAGKNNPKRPNVLFIMSDDHTSQAISAYGGMLSEVCPTPNIDRIAKEGVLFKNCFVTNSICTPSRAAIFTGNYSHINGVYKFTALDQSQPTLPKIMKKAGYETAFVGKYHLHSNPVGLDYWSILPGQGRYHNPKFIEMGDENPNGWVQQGRRTTYQGHSSDVIADKALDYLKNKRSQDKPFMFFCHFKAPHDTWEYAERYSSFLEDVEIPEPPNLFDDYEGRSDMLKKQLQYIGSAWGDHTNFEEETAHLKGKAKKKMQYQLYMKKYLRCVKGVDDNVGRILDYLDESGLAENTIVMYTGDQGFFLGEHGLYDKRIMYEEALRMPFLVRWPGKIKPGSVTDGMALNIDFAPTILQAAGAKPHADMQGRSVVPLLLGTTPSDWRRSMYYRYYYSHFETEPHFGVRTHTHKLIHFDRIDQWELYDLVKDPQEMNNVYNDPAYQNVVKELKRELKRLQAELGDDPQDTGENPRLKQYFQTLNKEELKVMVAALLRGWEMETPPVPPNKKGIDVMAVMDPMEAESGTFKVQINHLTTDHDVQNLINQLQPQKDAGFILSLDGLSPEAEKLAKQTGVRLELVDLNWFVSMWEETYPEMSKKDRALIPFDPYKVQVKR